MKKNNKTLALLIVVLAIAFSPLLIIKTFNLKDKVKVENTSGKSFFIISMISDMNQENLRILVVIIEASLLSGLTGFFIGYYLFKKQRKKDMASGEVVCPLCKEKFIKKTFKTGTDSKNKF